MENKPNAFTTLFTTATDYLETRVELIKLKAVSKSTDIVASVVAGVIIGMLIFFGIIMINIGLCIWIGYLLGQTWYGFFAVGAFYILLAVLTIAFKSKWIKAPISNFLVKKMLN